MKIPYDDDFARKIDSEISKGPRLNLNNNIANKRGKLPIDVADRMFWIGHAMGCQSIEHLRMRHTPREKLTREFTIAETNRYLKEMEMPPMNANETALFIFIMTKYMTIEKAKKTARMDSFIRDATKRFENK